MPEITAAIVSDLRARTGQGMMECKKMLQQTDGDIEKAIDAFRKKGVKASLGERSAKEGRIAGSVSPDGKSGVLVEINCSTDFTARSAPFVALADMAAQLLLADPKADLAQNAKLTAKLTEVSQQTGEPVRLGRTAHVTSPQGRIGLYLYTVTGKIGVLVSAAPEPHDQLLRDLGMHVTAKKPSALALTREELPADVVAREREIAVAAAVETGKPQAIAEKIAEGKLRIFYEERVLLDQEFINPDKFKGSISAMLKQHGATMDKYVRLEVGQ